MTRLEKITLILLGVVLLVLTAAYVYGAMTQWDQMTARPVRIAYLIGDLTVLYPLAIAAAIGMMRNRAWGRNFMFLTLGALLFDTAHQVYYLFGDNYFGAPTLVVVALLVVIVAYACFGYYALTRPRQATPSTKPGAIRMNGERTEPIGTDRNRTLMRVGAFSALIWVALQIVGNILHPRLPADAIGSMEHIAHSSVWFIAHVVLLFDYIVLIPMIVGFAAAFAGKPWTVQLSIPLMVVAVTVGIAQVALHPTTLHVLSEQYAAAGMAGDTAAQSSVIALYDAFWRYNIVMEIGHLLVIHLVVVFVAIAMFRESLFPRWLAWLGVAGGIAAAASLIVGEVFLESSVLGDALTFGIGLLPSAVWLVAVAIVLLKVRGVPATAAATAGGVA